MMNPIHRGASSLALVVALAGGAGCGDNIAVIGRPTLQGPSAASSQDEFVATVQWLDTSSRQINLRPANGRARVVGYHADTRLMRLGREYPVSQLEAGDVVAMQLRQDSRGDSYTDLIRVQESSRDWDRGRTTRSETGIQTVDGRVEQVDFQRSSFEMRDQARERIFVSLPYNAPRADLDRVRALRVGDYVRAEGRFLDRDRFELENFLRDTR